MSKPWSTNNSPQPFGHSLTLCSHCVRCWSSSRLGTILVQPGLGHGTLTNLAIMHVEITDNIIHEITAVIKTRHPRVWWHDNNDPTMQFLIGFPRNTQSKSFMLSLTEYAWKFQYRALWDTLRHALSSTHTCTCHFATLIWALFHDSQDKSWYELHCDKNGYFR